MENERFEKKVTIEGYRPLDFKTDSGDRIQMCKLTYSYISTSEDRIGRQFVVLNLPYEYCELLKGNKLPLEGSLVFTIEDLTQKPNIVDLKINKVVYNK